MTAEPPDPPSAELPEQERPAFRRLLDKLSAEHQFDFRKYKVASLARRIRARMNQVRVADFDAYVRYLDAHADEPVALFNAILINVTGFFRDPEAWEVLGRDVLPRIVEAATRERRGIRVWSAGCSTGEEPYSVAIGLAATLGERSRETDVKIYATDVDEEALGAARQGLYRLEQLKDLPAGFIDRYFTAEGHLFQVRRDLRRWCIFGRHNLAVDPPLSRVDLIVCRNVLIYFKSDLQERLLPRFHHALREGGYLFLGKSESLLARSHWFTPVNGKWRIFQRTSNALPLHDLTALVRPNPEAMAARPEAEAAAAYDARRLAEVLPVPVIVVDAADTIQTWNQAAAALYEISASAAAGKKFRDLDISYRVEGLRARIEDVKLGRASARIENVSFTRRSGDRVYVDFALTPLLDDRAQVAAVVVAAVDVSEQARLREDIARLSDQHSTATEELQSTNEELETTTEELQSTNEELETTNEELQSTNEELLTTVDELQAANTQLGQRTLEARRLAVYQQSVTDIVTEAVVVLDRSFTVTTWNQAAERLWGLRARDAVGREFFALSVAKVPPEARDAITRAAATPENTDVASLPFETPAGARAVLRIRPLVDSDGEILGVVVMVFPANDR